MCRVKIVVVSLFLWFAGPLWAQSSISAQMKEGQRHFDAGHFKEASLCFSKAIEKLPASKPGLQNPELAMAYYARALCLLKLKDNGSAVVDFNKCIFLDTTLQEAYYNRAVAYHATQNYHFALADLSRFLSYQPADTSARQLRMRMAQQMSEFELAASDAWYLYRLQGQERFFKEWTNHCLMGELWGRYVLGSDTALLEHPQWTWIHMDRAWALHVQGSYEQSQGEISLYMTGRDREFSAYHLQADNCTYMGEYEKARQIYSELMEMEPNNADLWVDVALVSLQEKDWSRAEKELTKAISSKTTLLAYAYLSRGVARYEAGKRAEACQDWNRGHMLGDPAAGHYFRTRCSTQP